MAIEHPFQSLFESFGRLPAAHAGAVNRLAGQTLRDVMSVALGHRGRCLLLRAPRAGYGKTHLLSRLQQHLTTSHEFLPLHAAAGTRIDAATVTDDTLRHLTRLVPAAGALSELDVLVRRLFSLSLQPLVRSGEVPCLDREGTLASLCERPVETFDFHHPSALSAHWTRDNFGVLGPRLGLELAQLTGCAPRAVGFWVEALFRFAVAPIDHPARVDALFHTAVGERGSDGAAMERLVALLALMGLLMRVVLVADDLDGLAAEPGAALRLASFVGSLRRDAQRVDVILSLNRDVWESAFVPHLSSALADRLSEVVVDLEPLTNEDRVALLESRTPGMGARMVQTIGPDPIERHARSLLRAAGAAWLKAARESSTATPSEPATSPPPLAMVAPSPALEPPATIPLTASTAAIASPVATRADPIAPEPPPLPTSVPSPPQQDETPTVYVPREPEALRAATIEQATDLPTPAPPAAPTPPAPQGTDAPATPPPPAQPAPSPADPAVPAPTPDALEAVDADRVDALLRQFRERYGRPDPE